MIKLAHTCDTPNNQETRQKRTRENPRMWAGSVWTLPCMCVFISSAQILFCPFLHAAGSNGLDQQNQQCHGWGGAVIFSGSLCPLPQAVWFSCPAPASPVSPVSVMVSWSWIACGQWSFTSQCNWYCGQKRESVGYIILDGIYSNCVGLIWNGKPTRKIRYVRRETYHMSLLKQSLLQ